MILNHKSIKIKAKDNKRLKIDSRKKGDTMAKELKGLCKNCLGCIRLESPDFEGVYQCEYASKEQLDLFNGGTNEIRNTYQTTKLK